jgi:hypothetical protein
VIEFNSAQFRVLARAEAGLGVHSILDLGTGLEILVLPWRLSVSGETMSGWVLRRRNVTSAAVSLDFGAFRLDRWVRITERVVDMRTTVHNVGATATAGAFSETFELADSSVDQFVAVRGGWTGTLSPSHSVSWESSITSRVNNRGSGSGQVPVYDGGGPSVDHDGIGG